MIVFIIKLFGGFNLPGIHPGAQWPSGYSTDIPYGIPRLSLHDICVGSVADKIFLC